MLFFSAVCEVPFLFYSGVLGLGSDLTSVLQCILAVRRHDLQSE